MVVWIVDTIVGIASDSNTGPQAAQISNEATAVEAADQVSLEIHALPPNIPMRIAINTAGA